MDWEEACSILGIKPTASPEEVEHRYRYKARILHPDATVGKPDNIRKEAEEEFKLVNEAYQFLLNSANNPLINPPKLKISPKHIRFKDVDVGQKKTTAFEIDSVGGVYTNIWFETEPCPWLSVTSFESTTSEQLPIKVTVECTGIGELGKQYSCKLPVRLENEKAKLKDEVVLDIELWTKARQSVSDICAAKPKTIVQDLTPVTLGIEFPKGRMKPVIARDTAIPVRGNVTVTTVKDNQPSIEIRVLAGDYPKAGDNQTVGRFVFSGFPRAPRGVPKIEVTLDIHSDGSLSIATQDKGTGKGQKTFITASNLDKAAQDVERKEKLELMKHARCPNCGHSLRFDHSLLFWRCTNRKCKRVYTYYELRRAQKGGKAP
jgi:predicted Zn-ribbon and HTH transcriptional regulator